MASCDDISMRLPSPQVNLSRREFIAALAAAGLLALTSKLSALDPVNNTTNGAWSGRKLPVVEPCGWRVEVYYWWVGDALFGPGEVGAETVHFYGTRWPKWSGFLGWLWRSEICRATSASITGPFVTREVLMHQRDHQRDDGGFHWDHHSVFNSTTVQHEGKVYLFYTGTHHDPAKQYGPRDVPQLALKATDIRDGYERMHQRVGLMIGDSPSGPWHRPDAPLFEPDEAWAPFFHSNPSATTGPDGKCYLYYKTIDAQSRSMKFAVAIADHPAGPFVEYVGNPIIDPGKWANIEDMCVWVEDGRFRMLFKDMSGRICGVENGTAILDSGDGLKWDLSRAKLAFTPRWPTPDGWKTAHRMEQANVLLREGHPAAMYCAILNGDERLDPTHPLHRRLTEEEIRISPPLSARNLAIALKRE